MHNSRINTAGSRNKNDLALYTHRRQIGQHHAKLEDKNLQRGLQHAVHNQGANHAQAAEIENHRYLNNTSSHPFLSERGRHAQANYSPPVIAVVQHQRDDYPRPQTLPQTYLSLAMYFANILPSAFPELAGMRFAKHLPHAVLVEKNQSATQNNAALTMSNLERAILKPSDHAPNAIRESYHGDTQSMAWHREGSEEMKRRAVRSVHGAASTPLLSGHRSTTNSYVPSTTAFPHREMTSAYAHTIATISTMASSSTMSPSAVNATTATAVMSSPTWLARETVRDTFIQYVQLLVPTIDPQASLSEVFKAYLQYDQRYRSHQEIKPTADNHPFMADWELQRYARDQFGWVDVDSPQMRSDIAHHLALSLVDVVNIKGVYIDAHHRIHQITYNGFSFRGFPSDTPILHAKHRIIEILSGAAQITVDIDNTQAKHFGLLLLSAVAPELCKLKDNDLAASKMIYGDRQHALLHIGIDVASHFEFSSQQYNTTQLKQIATAVMKEMTIPLLDDGRISAWQASKGLPWSDAGLLFMANAQSAIDLSEIHKKNTTTLTQQLERFIQNEFKNEKQVRDALTALKDAEIPTRKKIAQSELTKRGINPYRQIEVESTVTGLSTGAVAVSRSSQRYNTTLVELWLNKHVETLPLVRQDIVHVEDRNALDTLPSLTALFDQSFNTYRNDIAQHIGELLAAALNMQTSKQQRKDAFFSLWTVADHAGFGFREKTMEDKFFIEMWHGRDYAHKKRENFFYVEGSQADCLTLKPLNKTLIDWMDNALHQLKTGQRRPQLSPQSSPIEYIMRGSESLEEFFNTLGYKFAAILRAMDAVFQGRLTATGEPAILRHEYVTSKDINVVTRSAGDIFVERHIDPLKQRAYGITPTEEMIEGAREFLLPLYGSVKSFLNWQTLSQAERLGSVFGGLLESIALIPGLYQLGKLGLSTTTLLAKTAQRGIGMAQRFGPKIGAKVSLATLKAGTPQLAKHSGKLVIEVVDMFFPIGGLPRGGGKLRRADAIDLTYIAQDMTGSHPELAAHFNKLAHARVTKEGNQWVVTDPAGIHYRHGPHYTVDGRDYRIASLGTQEHVLLKKHVTEDGFYFTAVNPLQDQAYGPRLHLSEHGKPYLDRQATAARLHGYAAPVQSRNIKTDTALVSLTHAQHSYASLDGRLRYIQMGDATVLTGQSPHSYYLLEKADEGHFYIVHPATSTSHQTDAMAISPDRAKIAVEVIDGKWQLILTDVPEQFAQIKSRETTTWQPHGRGETFTVARLSDSHRVVALKAEGGKYREVDWATGKPRHDRSFIYKNSDGLYSHGALRGSGPKKKKVTPAHVETEAVAAPRQQNSQQEKVVAVVEPAASRRRIQDIRQENAARITEARLTVESEIRKYQERLEDDVHRMQKMEQKMTDLEMANQEVAWLQFSDRYAEYVEKMIDEGEAILNFMKNIDVEAIPVVEFKQKLSEFYMETARNMIASSRKLRVIESKLGGILKAMMPEGSMALRAPAPQDRAAFLVKVDLFIACFGKLSQAQRKFDQSHAGRISVEQLREIPFLRSIESEKLLDDAKRIEARELSQDFFSGGMHIRLLEMKVDLELRLKAQDSPHAQDLIMMSESTREKFIFADSSFVEATLNKRMPGEIAALRRLDLGHETVSFEPLSDEDRLRVLFSLDEQYKEVVLESSWQAEQCTQQGWLEEENIYRKLSQLTQERQTLAAKVLDDFLLKQAQSSVSRSADNGVAAVSRQAPTAVAGSDLIVIETELGVLAGKKKQGHADIVEIKNERGETLAEYEAVPTSSQITSTQRTWVRKQSQVADESLLDEINALRVREDLTKVANKLNNKVEEWVKKAQQFEREKEKSIKLANWMVDHPPVDETSVLEPARIQKILVIHSKEIDEHVKKMTSIRKQFEHLTKKLPGATMRDDVEAPLNDLKQLSIKLQQKGKECRVRLIKKQSPNDAGVRYLAELKAQDDSLAAAFEIKRVQQRVGLKEDGSYFDEYKITIDENLPKWYAHFHYKNRNDNDNKFIAAHLKQESEDSLGKNWEKMQMTRFGVATKIYRARIQQKTAESFFFR